MAAARMNVVTTTRWAPPDRSATYDANRPPTIAPRFSTSRKVSEYVLP